MDLFETRVNEVGTKGGLKVCILKEGAVMSYHSVIASWQQSEIFRTFYIGFLSSIEYIAYRWETPPLSSDTVHRPFEFVIIDSPGLDILPDADAFAGYFSDKDVVAFPNLGKDAWLVAPCPKVEVFAYGHLAVFSRHAPDYQNHALWQRVGRLVATHLDNTPRWLNTAGGGVAWLHIRLDNRPKYYCHSPYRSI